MSAALATNSPTLPFPHLEVDGDIAVRSSSAHHHVGLLLADGHVVWSSPVCSSSGRAALLALAAREAYLAVSQIVARRQRFQ